MIASAGLNVRIIHQTGRDMHSEVEAAFRQTGLMGEVVPFLNDMPAAFAVADLVVCRSGASTVSELAAAGKASVLVPFPFAADDHQLRNAEALERAGGARLVLDQDMTGDRLYREIAELIKAPEELATMRTKIRQFAKPNAAISAADALEGSAVR
jgi:UDP-N-acetylglucosamine--N-acetylmuramyl-(pentapeptide) pyrophosphoryl-undecaprenol N-acetylglucosamine transferase